MGAAGGLQGNLELRRRVRRAIDLFSRGRGEREARPLACRYRNFKAVAAGDAARGVDEDRGEAFVLG